MLIIEKEPKSIVSESYRTLRTNIQYSSFDKKVRVIVITSADPEEGKSTTAGNLALSLAQDGKNVILIDCDLRKPSLHKKFKLSNTLGLSEVLIGKEPENKVAQWYSEHLVVLTSGTVPPNPSEMLASNAMTKLINKLKETFHYIIIDTPPVQSVTDSQILSAKADGTILVVKSQETKKDSIKNAIGLLRKVNANILGIVLNEVEVSKKNYYY